MGTWVKLSRSTKYVDQDGKPHPKGAKVEMDEEEAKRLIAGGSAVRLDKKGKFVESETE